MPSNNSENSALSVIILAGGHSQRMGCDKALLPWQNRTLIEHVIAQAQRFSNDLLVITGERVRYRSCLDVRIYPDEIKNRGPLGGLYTGLLKAHYKSSLVIACDMPFVSRALVDLLCCELNEQIWAIVPEIGGHRVPTLAIYCKSCLSVIERLLRTKRNSLQALLDAVPTKVISEDRLRSIDPELRCCTNLNTPEDWTNLGI